MLTLCALGVRDAIFVFIGDHPHGRGQLVGWFIRWARRWWRPGALYAPVLVFWPPRGLHPHLAWLWSDQPRGLRLYSALDGLALGDAGRMGGLAGVWAVWSRSNRVIVALGTPCFSVAGLRGLF